VSDGLGVPMAQDGEAFQVSRADRLSQRASSCEPPESGLMEHVARKQSVPQKAERKGGQERRGSGVSPDRRDVDLPVHLF
jgi:hypothetical protein